MPNCVACGAELEPPVRAPHTVYVKTLYRIGGQDYWRHHIIRAAVAACPASTILAESSSTKFAGSPPLPGQRWLRPQQSRRVAVLHQSGSWGRRIPG